MDLFTRCTRCETVFRVTTGDLQASGGQVRCGRCQAVFDAFASLTAKPPNQAQDHAAAKTDGSARREDAETDLHKPASRELAPHQPETREPALNEPESERDEQTLHEPVARTSTPEMVSESVETTETEISAAGANSQAPVVAPPRTADRFADDPATNLYEWEFKAAPKLPQTRLWLSLSLLLTVTAIAQAAYVYRTHLMVNFPQVRPLYEQVCLWISCEIGLPRLADQLDIDASDLQLINPQKRSQVELTALVRNRAPVAVEYPAFELTLTNEKEQVVARRVFLPDEYLSDVTSMEEGFAGRGELTVRLFLDIGPLGAAGYRIYLFYPP